MRIALICLLAAAATMLSQTRTGPAESPEVSNDGRLEKLLTTYLQGSLEQARLTLKHKQQMRETGLGALPEVLAGEDEIDKWQLYLRLATEGKLIAAHPAFSDLRREFSVPDSATFAEAGKREVIAAAILEYLEKRLARANRASDWAAELFAYGRTTELQALEARNKVEGLRLLLEAAQLNVPRGKERR
jgi:hypothetical protein